jgi:hypothetical protein
MLNEQICESRERRGGIVADTELSIEITTGGDPQ